MPIRIVSHPPLLTSDIGAESQKPVQSTPFKEGLKKTGEFAEGVTHVGVSAIADVGSSLVTLPGNFFRFINDVIAKPTYEYFSGEEGVPYEKTTVGKIVPDYGRFKKDLEELVPYVKPRNKYESFANEVYSTAALFSFPGGQARVGLITNMSPETRALMKGLGVAAAGGLSEDLTQDSSSGVFSRTGAFLLMSLLDRKGARSTVRNLYKKADEALKSAGSPTVSASNMVEKLTELKNRLSQGVNSPSEQAVIRDIDLLLNHVTPDGRYPVQNLRSSLIGINENIEAAVNSAQGRSGRLRARKYYNSLNKIVNDELSFYGNINKDFGIPFKEAQRANGVIEKSNLMQRAVEKLTGRHNPGLLNLLGGGAHLGAASGLKVLNPAAPLWMGTYQALKVMYRMRNSPALRRHYLNAAKASIKENQNQFAKEVSKMDKILDHEDEKKKPIHIIRSK